MTLRQKHFEFSGSVIRAVPPGAGHVYGHVEGEFQSTSPACKCGTLRCLEVMEAAACGHGSLSVMTSLAFDGTIIVVAPLGATTARRRRTKTKEDGA